MAPAEPRMRLGWVSDQEDDLGRTEITGIDRRHVFFDNGIAGASIAFDAIENGFAIDDRPRKGQAANLLRRLSQLKKDRR